MNEKKKIYEKGWFSVLMLFMFFPVGVFLLWRYHRNHKILNIILTAISGFVFLVMTSIMFSPSESLEDVSKQNTPSGNIDTTQTTSPTTKNSDNVVTTEPTTSAETSTPITEIESISEQNSEQTEQPVAEAAETSIEELRTLFVNYASSKNDSIKNRLENESSEKLYDMVILTLQTIPKDPSGSKITEQTELDDNILKNIESVCNTYLEIFDTSVESDKIRELRDYAIQLVERNDLLKKYETDSGNLLTTESEGVYSMGFYIQNSMGVIGKSKIDSFLIDLGIYGDDIPPSYGGTIGYEEAFGTYLPSDERCVVQPLSEYTFSQAGIYVLNVIYGGEMEVVDTQGFKSFVPVYVEVSDEFVEQFLIDVYSLYDVDYDTIEQSIRNYLLDR